MPSEGFPQRPPDPQNVPATDALPVLLHALMRLGVPTLIFGATFLALVTVLTLVMTPGRFPIQTGTSTVLLNDLMNEENRLLETIEEIEKRRMEAASSMQTPVLHAIGELKPSIVPIGATLTMIEDIRASFTTPRGTLMTFPGVSFDAATNVVTISGNVVDPEGESMSVLAKFVDHVRRLPDVASVTEPEYTSTAQPQGSTSPFVLTIRLQHAS